MLSLLSCSVSRLDDFDTYTQPAPPTRKRSISRSLSFIKTASPNAKKRAVGKMSIGSPTDFRHKLHIGKDVGGENMIALWDSARWQQELQRVHGSYEAKIPLSSGTSHDSRSSLPASIPPPSPAPPTSPTKPNASKRHSIPPQKRKPVPSLVPDMLAPSPLVTIPAHDIPLPPSPTAPAPEEVQECEPSNSPDCHSNSRQSLDETAEVPQEEQAPEEGPGDNQAASQLRV